MTERKQKLEAIWRKVERDPGARRALKKLARDGFVLGRNTQLRIAEIPFLDDHRSKSRLLRAPRASTRVVVGFLRELSKSLSDPHRNLEARNDNAKWAFLMREGIESEFPELKTLPELLDRIFAYRWVVTERNPQHHAIATLELEIQSKTGDWHHGEVLDLLDAVARAAGKSFTMKEQTLSKLIEREILTRRTAHQKRLLR